MTRLLYKLLVWLHPTEFRNRFGDEMELIFEEASGLGERTRLILDVAVSLGRRWFLRPAGWKWAAATVGGMISLFIGFGGFLTWAGIWQALRMNF